MSAPIPHHKAASKYSCFFLITPTTPYPVNMKPIIVPIAKNIIILAILFFLPPG